MYMISASAIRMFLAPQAVKQAMIELLDESDPVVLHGYTNSNSGYADVRQTVAESVNERFGTAFTGENIVMTVGAAGGLNVIFKTLLDPGDEVIAFCTVFWMNIVPTRTTTMEFLLRSLQILRISSQSLRSLKRRLLQRPRLLL